jgi:DNA polymerase sigma
MVVCYGSMGTYLPTGDIDPIVLREPGDTDLLLSQIQRHSKSLKVFQMFKVIQKVRTPIIKGVESPFGSTLTSRSTRSPAPSMLSALATSRDLSCDVSASAVREAVPASASTR